MNCAIGFDIGTTKICALAIDLDSGKVIDCKAAPNDFKIAGKPFESLQDAELIFSKCMELVGGIMSKSPVKAIGVTGQMHGILYLDREGRALSPLYTWQDRRADEEYKGKTYSKVLSELTGYDVPSGFGLATHYYNLKNNLVPKGAHKITTVHSYVVSRMCGNSPLLHSSDRAALGVYDIAVRRTDSAALQRAGIDPGILPECVEGIAGEYKGIPVSVAVGDNQASFLGSVRDKDMALINIGTGSQISLRTDAEKAPEGIELRPLYANENLLVGCQLCGGSSYAVLKDMVKSVLKLFNADYNDDIIYDALNRAGENNDGSLHCDTLFMGTRQDPSVRGSITGIDCSNFTISNLAYAFLKGMADKLFKMYEKMGVKAKGIAASGNAVRKNPLLRAILEQTFGLKIKVPSHSEEAAFGAALFALAACGRFDSLYEACEALIRYIGEDREGYR